MSADVRVVLRRTGEAPQEFTFERPEGDSHNQAMVTWAGRVRDAVTNGDQVAPSFADGVACMRVMEQWRVEPPVRLGTPTVDS